MATHTSILAWKNLVREGPGGLQSRGSQSWTRLSTHTHTHPWFFQVVCASLVQDGFKHEGFWEVGRTYYGLASPPCFWPLSNSSG